MTNKINLTVGLCQLVSLQIFTISVSEEIDDDQISTFLVGIYSCTSKHLHVYLHFVHIVRQCRPFYKGIYQLLGHFIALVNGNTVIGNTLKLSVSY